MLFIHLFCCCCHSTLLGNDWRLQTVRPSLCCFFVCVCVCVCVFLCSCVFIKSMYCFSLALVSCHFFLLLLLFFVLVLHCFDCFKLTFLLFFTCSIYLCSREKKKKKQQGLAYTHTHTRQSSTAAEGSKAFPVDYNTNNAF